MRGKSLLLFVFTILTTVFAYSKDVKNVIDVTHRQVIVNTDTSYIVADVLLFSEKRVKKLNDNVIYTWYKRNSIKSTMGNYSGILLDGSYVRYDLSGNMKAKGNYIEGVKDGKWYYWSKYGTLIKTITYSHGMLNGTKVQYNSNGVIIYSVEYKNGIYQGMYIKYNDGIKISESQFKRGTIRKANLYKDNILFKRIFYNKYGKIKREKYFKIDNSCNGSNVKSKEETKSNKENNIGNSIKKFWHSLFNKEKSNSEEIKRL